MVGCRFFFFFLSCAFVCINIASVLFFPPIFFTGPSCLLSPGRNSDTGSHGRQALLPPSTLRTVRALHFHRTQNAWALCSLVDSRRITMKDYRVLVAKQRNPYVTALTNQLRDYLVHRCRYRYGMWLVSFPTTITAAATSVDGLVVQRARSNQQGLLLPVYSISLWVGV